MYACLVLHMAQRSSVCQPAFFYLLGSCSSRQDALHALAHAERKQPSTFAPTMVKLHSSVLMWIFTAVHAWMWSHPLSSAEGGRRPGGGGTARDRPEHDQHRPCP
jgi:hypothetical protein